MEPVVSLFLAPPSPTNPTALLQGTVASLAASPDGALLASGGSIDFAVKLWDATSGEPIRTLRGAPGLTIHGLRLFSHRLCCQAFFFIDCPALIFFSSTLLSRKALTLLSSSGMPPAANQSAPLEVLLQFRVQGSEFRVQSSGFRVRGSGFRVQGSGFRVRGSGFRAQGSGSRVRGSEFLAGPGFPCTPYPQPKYLHLVNS